MTQRRHVWTLHDVPCVAGCGADDITCAGCGLCQECLPSAVDGVQLLLIHAKARGLPNLRVWCRVWLDPVNEGAKVLAERHLRAWIEQGDINADASL